MIDQLRAELADVLIRLAMVSQVAAVNLEPHAPSSDEAIGGRRPPGGIDHKDDREPSFRQKSAEHFRRRAAGCRTIRDYQTVLADAKAALEAWQRTPVPSGQDPEYGSPQWKRWVAESELSLAEVARRFHLSRSYVKKIRDNYRDAA